MASPRRGLQLLASVCMRLRVGIPACWAEMMGKVAATAGTRSLGIEGVIRVRLVVDENGKVKDTRLLNRLGHGLDELALERAKKIEFEPARDTDDKAVSSVVVWTFNMTLPK